VTTPPISLKNYFIANLSVKANEIADGGNVEFEGTSNATTIVQVARHADNKNDWKVTLRIACAPKEKNLCSYFFDLELVGFFETFPQLSPEMAADIIAVNGPSTLYGAARELILLVTGRGPFPPVSLPSVSFTDEAPSKKKKPTESTQSESSPK